MKFSLRQQTQRSFQPCSKLISEPWFPSEVKVKFSGPWDLPLLPAYRLFLYSKYLSFLFIPYRANDRDAVAANPGDRVPYSTFPSERWTNGYGDLVRNDDFREKQVDSHWNCGDCMVHFRFWLLPRTIFSLLSVPFLVLWPGMILTTNSKSNRTNLSQPNLFEHTTRVVEDSAAQLLAFFGWKPQTILGYGTRHDDEGPIQLDHFLLWCPLSATAKWRQLLNWV